MTGITMKRRAVLASLGALGATPLMPGILAAQTLDTLAFFGPPAGPSITLAQAVATDAFSDIATTASFAAWRTPDELRAGLTSGTMQLAVVPIQAAANLYNRGFPLKLANVMTGKPPVLPQAGLIATNAFLELHGGLMAPIQTTLQTTVADVLAHPKVAAKNASAALGMPAPVLAASIPFSKLVARPAQQARPDIEAMLSAMAGANMEKIGGKMPDDNFYL